MDRFVRLCPLERWSYRTDEVFSFELLERMVKRELPASVYRCKGIVFTSDFPDMPLALQVVGRRTQLIELDGNRKHGTHSEIVAIGRGIDEPQLTRLFAACHIRQRQIDLAGRHARFRHPFSERKDAPT